MRCNECNIDLGEEYTKCPLCGAAASNEKPHLEGIKTAAYPIYDNEITKKKKGSNYPQKYVLRVSVAVCAVLFALSFVFGESLWVFGAPVIIAINSAFYFICGILEKKGKLLHSLVALLATLGVSLVTIIVSLATHMTCLWLARAFALCSVAIILLCLLRRKRAGAQLRALFNL